MIHAGLRGVLVDGFPFAATHVKSEGDRRRLRRNSVVADAVVVIRIVAPAGEIYLLVFLRTAGCDAILRGLCVN